MQKNRFLLYILLFLLVVLAGSGSFWEGMFSLVKFILIFISLVIIVAAIKFWLIYKKLKDSSKAFYQASNYYSRSSNPKAWNIFFGSFSPKNNYHQSREQNSPNSFDLRNIHSGKTIEICPNCGYEKGEHHVCK